MQVSTGFLAKPLVGWLAILLTTSLGNAAPVQEPQLSPATPVQSTTLPVSKNAGTAHPAESAAPSTSLPSDPSASESSTNGNSQSGSSNATQSPNGKPWNTPLQPVGTAAAPYEKSLGVTAARPAGAAIAPAKQRRVRIIFVRVALIVGAGVAIGTVMALSHASPSHAQ